MRVPHPGRHSKSCSITDGVNLSSREVWVFFWRGSGRTSSSSSVCFVFIPFLHTLSFLHFFILSPSSIPSHFVFSPFLHTLSFRAPFKSLLMFENMVMIKRTPKMVHLNGPAMPAPSGMHSNFVNPSNLKTEGLVLVTFCLILSTLVVGMRMWTKSRVVRKIVLEDCKSTFFRPSLL